MKKVLVAFKTKYGSTKQYAEWISEELNCSALPLDQVKSEDIKQCDVVVFGGYLYAGKIMGAEFINNNWPLLQGKEVILFTASGSPPESQGLKDAFNKGFPEPVRAKIRYFPMPGRMGKLDLKDNILMLFPRTGAYLSWLVKRDERSKFIAESLGKPFDHVKKENIEPLVREVESIRN
ncbi:MAG: hypothetical protein KGH72_01920 [Candidatus Micrarchaeota archaeon]|nr:hypothetical protein [Candidatus Micrarchaeota archaeon]